eukprot:COSAG05_NODE_8711_length_678_cov_1.307427_1_plen_81_part_10
MGVISQFEEESIRRGLAWSLTEWESSLPCSAASSAETPAAAALFSSYLGTNRPEHATTQHPITPEILLEYTINPSHFSIFL